MAALRNPVADERAMVTSSDGRARFTILTDRLIRMEWSADGAGEFEDRASQAFINRRLDVPAYRVERLTKGVRELRIMTDRVSLSFFEDGKAFHEGNLRVEFGMNDQRVVWTPGMDASGNLGGTTRTLDMIDGSCPIEPGLLSRDGWVVVDDSKRLVLDPAAAPDQAKGLPELQWVHDWEWAATRESSGALDWYFFGYGRDYTAALKDYTKVAGRIPLPPKWVFGSWWSRYWAYTDAELRTLVEEFRTHDVPLDVLVIDMDWHLDGWTGYTWSPAHFPDADGFLQWARGHGLQITLNLHPADGVGKHEAMFTSMCGALGLDPAKTEHIPFDCTDRRFMEAYFTMLHWPLEKQGVDFWWMDWQQGTKTATPGLDPLWWLNHTHWVDLEERSDPANDPTGCRDGRRPVIFSRWGGLGNHRYPVGFSGDTFSTWPSLAWQPEFTAVAGNVGYAYWSHDIGGHQPGPVEPELYARWVQYAILSPVLRTHTSKNPQGERRIWASPEREFRAMRESFLLRYKLIPYIYTAARRCYDEALPLCRPLYYEWPELNESYEHPTQYLFGDDLLAAPVCVPGDKTSRCAAVDVWLPPGTWTNWFTGETLEGPRKISLHVPLEEVPLFARGGAIIPTAPKMTWTGEKPLDPLTLIVWPGGTEKNGCRDESGCGSLYEDDGQGAGYERGEYAVTKFGMKREGDLLRVTVHPAEGSFAGMVESRAIEIRVVDRWPARGVSVDGQTLAEIDPEQTRGSGYFYDEAKFTIVIRLGAASVRQKRMIEVELDAADEMPLRAGLHGSLKRLDWVSTLLDGHAPASIRDMASVRRRIFEARGVGAAMDVIADRTRWSLASEIAHGDAAAKFQAEAVCRLLGLSCMIEVETDPLVAGRVRMRATARLSGSHRAATDFEADVTIAPKRSWKPDGASPAPRGALRRGEAVTETAWIAESPLQMTDLHAEVHLQPVGERDIIVKFEQAVFPSINGWWVVGPFPCAYEETMKTAFGPEKRAEPSLEYDNGRGASLKWRRADRVIEAGTDPSREFVVDLHKALDCRDDDAVAYALTYLDAPREMDAVLALGSDDGPAVWLNGTKVHEYHVQRGYGSRQDTVPLKLKAGVNTLLIKITQAKGGWSFGAHLEHQDGRALTEVTVRAQP